MQRLLSSLVFTVALLCPWAALAQTPPANCSVTSQNLWVRDQLNDVLLLVPVPSHQRQRGVVRIARSVPRRRFAIVRSTTATATSRRRGRQRCVLQRQPVHRLRLRAAVHQHRFAGAAGVRRQSCARSGPRARRPHYVGQRPDGRGDDVPPARSATPLAPSEIGVTSEIVFEKPSGERRTARMVKRLVTIPTVSLTRVIDVDGRKVGYLFFRNFVRPSEAALNDAFAALRTAGATELVLDLRYNGGGLVDIAVHLSSLIGGARTSGQVLLNYVHNDKVGPQLNKTTRFTNPEQALNLQRLVVITTRASASASELLINSLRPVHAGDRDRRHDLRQARRPVPIHASATRCWCRCRSRSRTSTTKATSSTASRRPARPADDISHQLGDPAEASLAEALTFIRTGACSAQCGRSVARASRCSTRDRARSVGKPPQRAVSARTP